MKDYKYGLLVVLFLFSIECNSPTQKQESTPVTELKLGDCLKFRDSTLSNFGLIVANVNSPKSSISYSFTPVKLDLSQKGMDQFIRAQLFLESFIDPDGDLMVEGTFSIGIPDREVEVFMPLNNILVKVGKVDLKAKYLFRSGGIYPKSMDEMNYIFDNWYTIHDSDARQVYVEDIINQ